MDKHSLELLLAQGISIERIGKRFGKDPSTVSYWVKKHGLSYSLQRLRTEAQKCVLLCATCHAEVEAGEVSLPATVSAYPRRSAVRRHR
jgi:transposase-like protein